MVKTVILCLLVGLSAVEADGMTDPGKCLYTSSKTSAWCYNVDYVQRRDTLPTTLRHLALVKSNIPTLNLGELNLPHLETLSLTDDHIVSIIPNNIISSPNFRNLKTLMLRSNDITSIEENAFASMPSLRILNLANNAITHMSEDALGSLTSLKVLDLSYNKLLHLSCQMLKSQTDIEELRLAQNQLGQVFRCMFENAVDSLEVLDLSHNELKVIQTGTFGSMTALKQLLLNSNQLTNLDPEVLSGLTGLQTLNLSHNKMKYLGDLFHNKFPIHKLILDGNQFQRIAPRTFQGLEHLRALYLKGMDTLEHIDPLAFFGLDELQILALEGNPKLVRLDWHVVPQSGLSSLEELYLTDCGISNLQQEVFTSLPSLKVATIHGNPLHCDCQSSWMRKTTEHPALYPWATSWTSKFHTPTCASPADVTGKTALELFPVECFRGVKPLVPETVTYHAGESVVLKAAISKAGVTWYWQTPTGYVVRPGNPVRAGLSEMVAAVTSDNNTGILVVSLLVTDVRPVSLTSGQYNLVVSQPTSPKDTERVAFHVKVINPDETEDAESWQDFLRARESNAVHKLGVQSYRDGVLPLRASGPVTSRDAENKSGGPQAGIVVLVVFVVLLVGSLVGVGVLMYRRRRVPAYERLIHQELDRAMYGATRSRKSSDDENDM